MKMQTIEASISLMFLILFMTNFANIPVHYKINNEIIYAQLNDYYNVLQLRNNQFELDLLKKENIEADLNEMELLTSKCIGIKNIYFEKNCEINSNDVFSIERISRISFIQEKSTLFIS